MIRSKLAILVIVLLVLCLVAASRGVYAAGQPRPGVQPYCSGNRYTGSHSHTRANGQVCAAPGCSSNGYADASSNHWGNSYPGGRPYS